MGNFEKKLINTVKRGAKKATYNKEEIFAILDACEVCHIAFLFEGKPFVQPINFGRDGNKIYVHGAQLNRMTTALINSGEVCLNVMILDAMKLIRSAFHHSVSYRSVNVFGPVRELLDDEEKLIGLKAIINHFVPKRWEHCRKPNETELKATRVLEITIETASAKIATGPPNDNQSDLELPFWAGTIPIKSQYLIPFSDEYGCGKTPPQHVLDFLAVRNS